MKKITLLIALLILVVGTPYVKAEAQETMDGACSLWQLGEFMGDVAGCHALAVIDRTLCAVSAVGAASAGEYTPGKRDDCYEPKFRS